MQSSRREKSEKSTKIHSQWDKSDDDESRICELDDFDF